MRWILTIFDSPFHSWIQEEKRSALCTLLDGSAPKSIGAATWQGPVPRIPWLWTHQSYRTVIRPTQTITYYALHRLLVKNRLLDDLSPLIRPMIGMDDDDPRILPIKRELVYPQSNPKYQRLERRPLELVGGDVLPSRLIAVVISN